MCTSRTTEGAPWSSTAVLPEAQATTVWLLPRQWLMEAPKKP